MKSLLILCLFKCYYRNQRNVYSLQRNKEDSLILKLYNKGFCFEKVLNGVFKHLSHLTRGRRKVFEDFSLCLFKCSLHNTFCILYIFHSQAIVFHIGLALPILLCAIYGSVQLLSCQHCTSFVMSRFCNIKIKQLVRDYQRERI